jgi:hypothetical protein
VASNREGPGGATGSRGVPVAGGLQARLCVARCDGSEMLQGWEAYSEEETALIAKGLSLLDSLAAGKGKVRLLRH